MTPPETKVCQNCKASFIVDAEDFDFYKKINVPPPTFCPECRMQRRFAFRNERTIYRRKRDPDGKFVISIYSEEKPFKVYSQERWWSDDWDPLEYRQEYDFSRSFFEQFKELWRRVPVIAIHNKNGVNSEYCCHALDNKNCYLNSAIAFSESVNYSNRVSYCKDSHDLYFCDHVEFGYNTIISKNSYKISYNSLSENCSDSAFLYDCKNCSHCFGCVNLRNKSYHIFNKPYSKEEYQNKIKEFDLGSYHNVQRIKREFDVLRSQALHKYANINFSNNVTGDNVSQSKNCRYCFDMYANIEDSAFNVWAVYDLKDVYDGFGCGASSSLMYEAVDAGLNAERLKFAIIVWSSHNVEYSYNCHGCSYLFGCISLRNKQYCILNKQYTKEEYETLVPKIIQHMNEMPYVGNKGRIYGYGGFFPSELSPFAYNETVAQEYFPLTKEAAIEKGFSWREPEARHYEITKKSNELPDHIKNIDDSILNDVIGCEHKGECNEQCTTAFKIIPQELQFYKKMNLSLPRFCPNCRHYERLKQRNPLKLWHRKCMCDYKVYNNSVKHLHHAEGQCPNEFETSYAPDRKEIVYCEQCYQAEVA